MEVLIILQRIYKFLEDISTSWLSRLEVQVHLDLSTIFPIYDIDDEWLAPVQNMCWLNLKVIYRTCRIDLG